MMKRISALLLLGVFFVPGIFAAMVSFVVIETGLPDGAGKNQYSERWESSLMDVFFEAGHIVSNAPILRLNSKPSVGIEVIAEKDIEEAAEGGSDYFIIALLDFTSVSQPPGTVSLLLFRIAPYAKLFERNIPGRSYSSVREESETLRNIVMGLVPHLE
jgi:hypothetical protein